MTEFGIEAVRERQQKRSDLMDKISETDFPPEGDNGYAITLLQLTKAEGDLDLALGVVEEQTRLLEDANFRIVNLIKQNEFLSNLVDAGD